MTQPVAADDHHALKQARWELLEHIDALADKPMIALSLIWLGLMIVNLTIGIGRPPWLRLYPGADDADHLRRGGRDGVL